MNYYILFSLRIAVIFIYLYYSINIHSFTSFLLCFILIFWVEPSRRSIEIRSKVIDFAKTNCKKVFSESTSRSNEEFVKRLERLTIYDATNVECLEAFKIIQQHSNCLFAKKAKLWGSCSFKPQISLEENICLWAPTFCKFCFEKTQDGFLFQLPTSPYALSMQHLANAVNRTLKFLTMLDSRKYSRGHSLPCDLIGQLPDNQVWAEVVGRKRWAFSFCQQTFFVSTFSPIYPQNHPRFTYGCDDVFILFQPEISFALHNLPLEHPVALYQHLQQQQQQQQLAFDDNGDGQFRDNYSKDESKETFRGDNNVRDKIREKFRLSGQEYIVYERMLHSIVLPTNPMRQPPIDFTQVLHPL